MENDWKFVWRPTAKFPLFKSKGIGLEADCSISFAFYEKSNDKFMEMQM